MKINTKKIIKYFCLFAFFCFSFFMVDKYIVNASEYTVEISDETIDTYMTNLLGNDFEDFKTKLTNLSGSPRFLIYRTTADGAYYYAYTSSHSSKNPVTFYTNVSGESRYTKFDSYVSSATYGKCYRYSNGNMTTSSCPNTVTINASDYLIKMFWVYLYSTFDMNFTFNDTYNFTYKGIDFSYNKTNGLMSLYELREYINNLPEPAPPLVFHYYLPNIESYSCYSVLDKDTIRAYEDSPALSSTINYRDYYINSHYIYKDGSQEFGENDDLPTCIDSELLTDNFYYRNDITQILIIFLILCIFGLYIPLKVFMRLFRRFN